MGPWAARGSPVKHPYTGETVPLRRYLPLGRLRSWSHLSGARRGANKMEEVQIQPLRRSGGGPPPGALPSCLSLRHPPSGRSCPTPAACPDLQQNLESMSQQETEKSKVRRRPGEKLGASPASRTSACRCTGQSQGKLKGGTHFFDTSPTAGPRAAPLPLTDRRSSTAMQLLFAGCGPCIGRATPAKPSTHAAQAMPWQP